MGGIDIKHGIPSLKGSENYWVISSVKEKELYEYFNDKNIIGLAWDKIGVEDVRNKDLQSIKDNIKNKYSSMTAKYKDESGFMRATTIFSKELNFFINEISVGDIVVVKDRNRDRLMFGLVISDVFENTEYSKCCPIDKERGNCNKFRRVQWLNIKEKKEVSELIINTMYNQQAISKITEERTKADINKTIFTLFLMEDKLHAVFEVKKLDSINFESYYNFIDLIHKFRKEYNVTTDFYIKSNVSSPGPIEIIGASLEIGMFLSLLGVGAIKIFKNDNIKSDVKNNTHDFEREYQVVKSELDIKDPGEDGFIKGN